MWISATDDLCSACASEVVGDPVIGNDLINLPDHALAFGVVRERSVVRFDRRMSMVRFRIEVDVVVPLDALPAGEREPTES